MCNLVEIGQMRFEHIDTESLSYLDYRKKREEVRVLARFALVMKLYMAVSMVLGVVLIVFASTSLAPILLIIIGFVSWGVSLACKAKSRYLEIELDSWKETVEKGAREPSKGESPND